MSLKICLKTEDLESRILSLGITFFFSYRKYDVFHPQAEQNEILKASKLFEMWNFSGLFSEKAVWHGAPQFQEERDLSSIQDAWNAL